MTWNFFKTNWFSFALVLLVLVAMFRSNGLSIFQKYLTATPAVIRPEAINIHHSAAKLGLAEEPSFAPAAPVEVDQATATAFLKRFAPVAVSERKKFGIPASILLAAAFLNSHTGLNNTALEANNFFALPCTADWEGESVSLGDQCLRKYETPWASWRDFSIFLSSQDWFGSLKQSAGKDWQKWCKGLNGKGVSGVSNFGQKMAEVITYYHLFDLDQK